MVSHCLFAPMREHRVFRRPDEDVVYDGGERMEIDAGEMQKQPYPKMARWALQAIRGRHRNEWIFLT
jgi:hypothetical protein